jgi:hypothetical protein
MTVDRCEAGPDEGHCWHETDPITHGPVPCGLQLASMVATVVCCWCGRRAAVTALGKGSVT